MWVLLALPILLVAWAVVSFNLLVRSRNMVSEAWSGIDVQLKRRHDLIPNLVQAVQSYSEHERGLFEKIAETRGKSISTTAIAAKGEAENALSGQLKSLLGIAESYPALKASDNFMELQKGLTKVEDDIQYARRYYNATVRDYNIRVQSFPDLILANMLGFKRADFFEIEFATERQAPDAKFD